MQRCRGEARGRCSHPSTPLELLLLAAAARSHTGARDAPSNLPALLLLLPRPAQELSRLRLEAVFTCHGYDEGDQVLIK